ncbi:MATE family efflux transporter [uncultured Maricaulis sp.]|uniref:MATE family efflux transporter n=1 Tax=uncultured Maricaulis sp. TaxID=174710 RepID=UPI0030DC2ECF|tara:strand:- start:12205 stop:13590 length:1386 start_codon:yes stop_codon:yes gene_type:complete
MSSPSETSRPALTRIDVIKRALPLVIANATVPLAGVVDTFVLGLSGDKGDLGGVALGGAIFSIFYWSFYFLRMGTTGLTAQADGAHQRAETQRILIRAVAIAALLGITVWLLRYPIAWGGFAVLQGEPGVETKGASYLLARAWGAPAALATFALTGWLIGLGRNTATLAIYAVFSGINIALDLWFVLGLGYGPGGVGAATAIAEWAGLLVGLGFVAHTLKRQGGWASEVLNRASLLNPGAIAEMFNVNINLMIRTWSLIVGFTWFANAGARQGTAILAGNHVLLQVITLWAFVLDAFAFIAETEAGRAFGRRSLSGLRRAVRLTGEPMFAAGAIFAVLTWLFGADILGLLIADPEARASAIRYLPWCAVIPFLGAGAWLMDGVFIGTTSGKILRNAGVAAVAIYLAADAALSPAFGNTGVWMAFLIFYIARGGTLILAYPSLERRLQSMPTASVIEAKPSA